MTNFILFLPVLYLAVTDGNRLEVSTEPAVASIVPIEDGRRLIQLPGLEFPMRIAAHCADGGTLQSVSVSVADTRQSFTSEDYVDGQDLETVVKVSAKQLAPVAVQSFCVAGEPPSAPLLLERTLTAQISLRCTHDDEASVIFESTALDVRLECKTPEAAEAD